MNITKSVLIILLPVLISDCKTKAQIPENPENIAPLLIGETMPNAQLIDGKGEIIELTKEIKNKPTVLVFYRGGWCPYCNLHLSALAMSEEEIIDLGYQIIAISPDDYKNLKPTIEVDELQYKLYSDPDSKLIQEIGIAFKTSSKTKDYISDRTIGDITEILPVPSIFVVNTKGKILFEHISPNYKKRITPELLLAVLKNLN